MDKEIIIMDREGGKYERQRRGIKKPYTFVGIGLFYYYFSSHLRAFTKASIQGETSSSFLSFG